MTIKTVAVHKYLCKENGVIWTATIFTHDDDKNANTRGEQWLNFEVIDKQGIKLPSPMARAFQTFEEAKAELVSMFPAHDFTSIVEVEGALYPANETDELPDSLNPYSDKFSENSEMDSDGRITAFFVEEVRADDAKLESLVDKIVREVKEKQTQTKEANVQISSITNVISGKTYVAAISTAQTGYCLMITGEGDNGLPMVYHKHYSHDINLLSREAMVLLHLSDPVHGEEFPVANNDLMNLPGNALQPIATKAAARTFAALNPKKPVTVGFSFRIDADIKNEFCKYCDERNYNYSEVLRMLMSTFLQESWSQ